MKLDIEVENLGKLKKGTVKVRPLTVLTGENGTGKSFFTKTLYSIFSTLNNNILHIEITKNIKDIEKESSGFLARVGNRGEKDKKEVYKIYDYLSVLLAELNAIKETDIQNYLTEVEILGKRVQEPLDSFVEYLNNIDKKPIKSKYVKGNIDVLKKLVLNIKGNLYNSKNQYSAYLEESLSNEIKENFQISNLSELISHGESDFSLSSELFVVGFNNNSKINFSLKHIFIDKISHLSRIVFFESPAYWKVRDALIDAKNMPDFLSSDLPGVPKYFYDLDRILRKNSKDENKDILKLSNILKNETKGEFIFKGGDLSFRDEYGNDIKKNLVSFGMTNLGMMQLLLKHNVINKGSFVFFDEPETNLHPQWQILLTKVLIELAKKEVNVVMATHSLDMIKALEVCTKNEDEGFIAINHFTKDGGLFKFADNNITNNLIESRNKLAESYEELFLSELYDGNE
jgi:predicted ATPase